MVLLPALRPKIAPNRSKRKMPRRNHLLQAMQKGGADGNNERKGGLIMASIRRIDGKGGVSYKITVTMGTDYTGKQIRRYKTWRPEKGMTAKQAEKEVKRVAYEFERALDLGYQADNRQNFAKYADYVYSMMEQRGDSPHSLWRFERMIKRVVNDSSFGNMKLKDVRPQHINEYYKSLVKQGSGSFTARQIVDFNSIVGNETKAAFAKKYDIPVWTVRRLCRGENTSPETAQAVETALNRKGIFEIVRRSAEPLSYKTLVIIHSTISTVFAWAEKEMLISYNPARKATLPMKKNDKEADCLQPDEVKQVISALQNEDIDKRAIVTLFIVTGCRKGEIMGLKWNKIDFQKREITIDCSLSYVPKKGVFEGPTKTRNTRKIILPEDATALLRKYRTWQLEQRFKCGDLWKDTGLVFTRWDGSALNPGCFNVWLSRFCEKNGIRHIHPHTFRHSAASIMLSNGVDVLTVAKMLGHADTSTTMNVYGHAIEAAQRKAAECIADVILGKKNT